MQASFGKIKLRTNALTSEHYYKTFTRVSVG